MFHLVLTPPRLKKWLALEKGRGAQTQEK